ncbi:MAG TPA: hypothetical protein VFK02_08225 [Kofleriaceae bacterium]|nr:hypothetical protein [Kofleriaceae bacterium]
MLLVACNAADRTPDLGVSAAPIKIGGSNCAGVREATTGVPVVTDLAAFYQVLQLDLRRSDTGRTVFETRVPADWEAGNRNWLAKAAQIVGPSDAVGFVGGDVPYFEGDLGLVDLAPPASGCQPVDPALYQQRGLLTHTAMLQLARCPSPDEDGYNKVGPLGLIWIGDPYDADALIDAGIARYVAATDPPPRVCLVRGYVAQTAGIDQALADPLGSGSGSGSDDGGAGSGSGAPGCVIALRDDAVIEAIVFDVDSSVVYGGVPVIRRAFTARGGAALPGGLDSVRKVLRSSELAALALAGDPEAEVVGSYTDGDRVHYTVRFTGHPTAPLPARNAFVTDQEQAQIDAMAGRLGRGLIVFVNGDTRSTCQPVCPSPAIDPPAEGRRCAG